MESYFEEFEELENEAEKGELAKKICVALTVHTQIEEEIFYPQARKATKDDAKKLIAEIEEMEPDAKVKVLG